MSSPNPFVIEEKITKKILELTTKSKFIFNLVETSSMCGDVVITNTYSAKYNKYSLNYIFCFDGHKKIIQSQTYVLAKNSMLLSRYHRIYHRDSVMNKVDSNLLSILKIINPLIFDNICEERDTLITNFLSVW